MIRCSRGKIDEALGNACGCLECWQQLPSNGNSLLLQDLTVREGREWLSQSELTFEVNYKIALFTNHL